MLPAQMNSGPEGPLFYFRETLTAESAARLTVSVDRNRRSRRVVHLYAMLDTLERIRHVPIVRCALIRNIRAALNVLTIPVAAAACIGSDSSARNYAANGSGVSATAPTDLMAQNTPNNGTGDRSADIGTIVEAIALDPATLLGRTDDCVHPGDGRLIQALARTLPVFICRRGNRWRRFIFVCLAIHGSNRRDVAIHPHSA